MVYAFGMPRKARNKPVARVDRSRRIAALRHENGANWDLILRPEPARDVVDGSEFAADVRAKLAEGTGCAVLFVSIDRLDEIRASHGQKIADDLWRQAGERLRRVEPWAASLAELPGREIALLVTRVANHGDAEAIALRCARALDLPFSFGCGVLSVTTKMGVAHAPAGATNGSALIHAAAKALQSAREEGHGWRVAAPLPAPGPAPAAAAKAAAKSRGAAGAADEAGGMLGKISRALACVAGTGEGFGRAAALGRCAVLGTVTAALINSHAAAMAPVHAGKTHLPMDPVFNLPYDPAQVHFETFDLSRVGDCAPLLESLGDGNRQAKLFAELHTRAGEVVILGDENPNAPRGLSGVLLVMRHGDCRTTAPLFGLRRNEVADPDLDPGLSAGDVAALMEDMLTRYARAFGGKENFLNWADRLTAQAVAAYQATPGMPCPLPFTRMFSADMLAQMNQFRGA